MVKYAYGIPFITLVFASLLASALCAAQSDPLSEKDVDRYIESLERLEPLSDQINAEDTGDAALMAELWLEGDQEAILNHLETRDYYPQLEAAVEKAGFDSAAEWVDRAQRITRAFTALEIGDESQSIAAEMEAGIQQIRDSQQLTPEQKEALIEQLESSQSQLAGLDTVSPADKAAVEPHMEKLRDHFEAANEMP